MLTAQPAGVDKSTNARAAIPRVVPLFAADFNPLRSYHAELQARLPARGRVLDLGCGDNSGLADYRTTEREVWGADFDVHPRLEHAAWFRRLRPGGEIPFPDEFFDAASARWVLEHVASPLVFLNELRRVLCPGGCFVAVTPHGAHYVTWMIRTMRLLPHPITQALVLGLYGRAHDDTHPARYRLNTPRSLAMASSLAGLELVRLELFANQHYFRSWPLLVRAAAWGDRLLDRASPGLGRLYMVLSLRKPA